MSARRSQRAGPVDMGKCSIDSCIAKTESASCNDLCTSPTYHAKAEKNDDGLIAMCRRFRSAIRIWIKRVEELGIETYDDAGEAGEAMRSLRLEWGHLVEAIRCLAPKTADGAAEKIMAARVYLEFSRASAGEAAELLALATSELDLVTSWSRKTNDDF